MLDQNGRNWRYEVWIISQASKICSVSGDMQAVSWAPNGVFLMCWHVGAIESEDRLRIFDSTSGVCVSTFDFGDLRWATWHPMQSYIFLRRTQHLTVVSFAPQHLKSASG